jgi:hypothetical protein
MTEANSTPPAGSVPPPQPEVPAAPPPIAPGAKDERMWGMFCHLAALAAFIGIPLGNVIGPLVVWLIKREQYPLVNEQGKESLNFQITVAIIAAVGGLLLFCFMLGLIILIPLGIVDLILVIMAAIKTNNGEHYRYPFALRLIK